MSRIVIIGAGASGMAAAITAANTDKNACIILLEKQNKPGSKLLATGNGRCNITNASTENYRSTLAFFESIGLLIREEAEGRMYPYSGHAQDVVDALERAIETGKIELHTGSEVSSVERNEQGFKVVTIGGETITGDKLILAAGGKAGPQFGTTGDGYKFARALGHSVGRLAPALTMIKADDTKGLKGIRAKARVTLFREGLMLAEETGELQFTENGLSGICIFNLSRFIDLDGFNFDDYYVGVDYAYDMSIDTVVTLLDSQKRVPGMRAEDILRGIVDKRIAERLYLAADGDIDKLAEKLKGDSFKVAGAGGWKEAQCTRGGVPLDEVNPETMESKIVPGLYLTGEVLDYDGPCGGYNLQHAWETGIAAGKAIVR